jgi:hypothetical protein
MQPGFRVLGSWFSLEHTFEKVDLAKWFSARWTKRWPSHRRTTSSALERVPQSETDKWYIYRLSKDIHKWTKSSALKGFQRSKKESSHVIFLPFFCNELHGRPLETVPQSKKSAQKQRWPVKKENSSTRVDMNPLKSLQNTKRAYVHLQKRKKKYQDRGGWWTWTRWRACRTPRGRTST